MTSDHASVTSDHAVDIDRHVRIYITVFVALMVLTIVTVAIAHFHLPMPIAIAVALLVATVKGSLVAARTMNAEYSSEAAVASTRVGTTTLYSDSP